MVRSDVEIPQSFIVENSRKRINFNSVTNVSLGKPDSNFGIFKQPSKNSPYHLWFKRCYHSNHFFNGFRFLKKLVWIITEYSSLSN